MKTTSILTALALVPVLSFGQAFKQNNKSSTLPDLPENPEKLKKHILDLKYKTTMKDKDALIRNFTINFHTRAVYQVQGSAAGYKVKEKKSKFIVKGISNKTYQEITDAVYDYYCSKLKEMGYTLADHKMIQSTKAYGKVSDKVSPMNTDASHNEYKQGGIYQKSFSGGGRPYYGAPSSMAWYKMMKETKKTFIDFGANVSFMNFGQKVGSTSTHVEWALLYEAAVHGNISTSFSTPKYKVGSVATQGNYRYEKNDFLTFTNEAEDGHVVAKADESKFKEYAIAYLKRKVDLQVKHMKAEMQ